MSEFDAVIAGAGPVGLMLACELGITGVRVLVVERRTEPDLTVKAGSVTIPTAEALERRGMLPAAAYFHQQVIALMAGFMAKRGESSEATASQSRRPAPAGHFAGLWNLDASRLDPDDPDVPQGPASTVSMVSQQAIEAILTERAAELDVEIRRGAEVTGFIADADGVTVDINGASVRPAGSSVATAGAAPSAESRDSSFRERIRPSPATRPWSTSSIPRSSRAAGIGRATA
jgi:2-polyprenyl-6-methoxyphenol hydroxylase-like FAD-dependent oxidoreductase